MKARGLKKSRKVLYFQCYFACLIYKLAYMNIGEYKDFWLDAKEKVERFSMLDESRRIFGARTRGYGHDYQILPVMREKEIIRIENEKKIHIPIELRSYLCVYGAGGAGPYYGVEDFRKSFAQTEFDEPFIPPEGVTESKDCFDEFSIDDYSGLIYVGTAGCGTEYYLELNGRSVGTVWCNWSGEGCHREKNFCTFYSRWLNEVNTQLSRHNKLRYLNKRFHSFTEGIKALSLDDIIEYMDCTYTEYNCNTKGWSIPEDEIWLRFDQTPGIVILNESRHILRIEIFDGFI